MSGSRAAAKARTHENLLDAAATVFAERGYGAASVEEIARTAGTSVGSVYAHFTSKEKLFVALMERRSAQEFATAQAELADGFEAAVPALNRQLLAEADSEHLAELGAEAWLYALRSPAFGAELAAHHRRVHEIITDMVAQERTRRGSTLSMSDEEVGVVAAALARGLVQHRRLSPESVPDDLFGRTLTALLAGLESPASPASPPSPPASDPVAPGSADA